MFDNLALLIKVDLLGAPLQYTVLFVAFALGAQRAIDARKHSKRSFALLSVAIFVFILDDIIGSRQYYTIILSKLLVWTIILTFFQVYRNKSLSYIVSSMFIFYIFSIALFGVSALVTVNFQI